MSAFVRGLVGAGFLASTALAHAEPAPANASAPVPAAPLRVYMRTAGQPLTFSARERSSSQEPTWCVAPCNAAFAPGDYQLRLNGVLADENVNLNRAGTLHGELHSRGASRSAGWLALNVGGIVGGVFITVGALGGPSWAYAAGGGSLLAGAVTFVVTYRADSATVTFTPSEPVDVRGMPLPPERSAGAWLLDAPDRARFAGQARGLGFRVAF
ncbi:MAG: hypothetical protein ABW061_27870 [Polyangiaceae bacterium]